jgi:hypothetical protein
VPVTLVMSLGLCWSSQPGCLCKSSTALFLTRTAEIRVSEFAGLLVQGRTHLYSEDLLITQQQSSNCSSKGSMVRFSHSPETIVFVIDLDSEMSTEGVQRLACQQQQQLQHQMVFRQYCPAVGARL